MPRSRQAAQESQEYISNKKSGDTSAFFHIFTLCLFLLEKGKNPKQDYRSNGTNQQLAPESCFGRSAKQSKYPAAQEATDDTDENANQKAHAFVHDSTCDEACQGSNQH